MPETDAFKDLIARVRVGDEAAASELVRRYEPTIRRVARIRLAGSGLGRLVESVDICQSVFASFFVRTALGQFELDKPEQLIGLLLNMSRKKLINQLRREGAARRDFRRLAGRDQGENVAAPGSTPSQHFAAKDLLEEFRKRLTDDERRLAEQRAQGREWADIAAEEGGCAEALRKKLTRAVGRVAEEVGLYE